MNQGMANSNGQQTKLSPDTAEVLLVGSFLQGEVHSIRDRL